jgi:hypothetical protein
MPAGSEQSVGEAVLLIRLEQRRGQPKRLISVPEGADLIVVAGP